MTTERATAPRRLRVPAKASLEGIEQRWGAAWTSTSCYAFDRTRPREQVYAIDTPPLTVSGSLHVGHVFSYTHIDLIARFQRMRGEDYDYVELVKDRAYEEPGDPATASARAALLVALRTFTQLFAPVLAYACEEVWSWWHGDSVHTSRWPEAAQLPHSRKAMDGCPLIRPVCPA
ncbi:MAG: class I tRNA ligase family protein [Pseudonocardiaceae bacterium]